MNKQTGGPAFPEIGNVAYNSEWQNESGMTLRDYFAAKAMQSFSNGSYDKFEAIAKDAYAMADAMLRTREASCE